jgi:hypothetical protein
MDCWQFSFSRGRDEGLPGEMRDEPGEQPPVAVMRAIAAAGGSPDCFNNRDSSVSVNSVSESWQGTCRESARVLNARSIENGSWSYGAKTGLTAYPPSTLKTCLVLGRPNFPPPYFTLEACGRGWEVRIETSFLLCGKSETSFQRGIAAFPPPSRTQFYSEKAGRVRDYMGVSGSFRHLDIF